MRLGPAAAGAVVALLAGPGQGASQTVPLAPIRESGQAVTPAFEGWYRNPDGTFSLSFGYYNRNSREALEIPVGPRNRIEPGGPDRGQPTAFLPRRHWGVFAVTVPADFGLGRVVWTLVVGRDTFAIPGSLKAGWEIDALQGEAGSGNTPPVLRFSASGPDGRGPGGITFGPLIARTGQALELAVWAADDGKAVGSIASNGRPNVPVTLTWFKHQGPGEVRFSNPTPAVAAPPADGKAVTSATFSQAGDYVLRVRANDASGVTGAGHAQCCWTNGFVKVKVNP
ncbi:MAG TPA: hypothetical protein VI383_07720 [Gemmatimonadales bacterium]|nr:hypothetical protein [Gemmatimonadales bacterium]